MAHPLESLPLKKCFYWGDRYLQDVEESGLYFDLMTVRRQDAESEAGLNTLINATNKKLQGVHTKHAEPNQTEICMRGKLD